MFCYLDDVIIVTDTFERHLEVLRSVFERLKGAGLTVNKQKCLFCRRELRYLGYIVNEAGLSVEPEKIRAILRLPTPSTVREVRSVIGMASWYRRFIPVFATLLHPITDLLRKGTSFVCDEACEDAWTKLKSFFT